MDYVCTDKPTELAAEHIANVLKDHLSKNEHVLWLLSGGSSAPIAIQASQKLGNMDLSNLSVTLTDERYGQIGHANENWQQLIDSGLSLPQATLYRPLIGENLETTTLKFNEWLSKQFKKSDFTLGIFGLGSDGHTAGIKPYSSAVTTPDLATSFHGDDFVRVTISFNAIKQIDEVVVQASGVEKTKVIDQLMNVTLPLSEQPAQILKEIPQVTIYTDNPKEEK